MKRILILFLLLIGIVSLSGCELFTKDNTEPPAPLVDFTQTLNTQLLWSIRVGHTNSRYYLRLSPVVVGNKIYTVDYAGDVSAVDINSGNLLWKINVGEDVTGGVSANDSKLFVVTEQGNVIALKQSDGSQIWKTPVGSEILASPTATSGVVLVKSIDGSLTGLDADSGKQLWHYVQSVPSLILHVSSQPEVAGSYVIAGFANGVLAVLNYRTGSELWDRPVAEPKGITDLERMVDIDVSPVVVKGIVYVATFQGKIAAMDLRTGKILWRHDISSYAGIAADFSKIYLSDAQSHVWAFDEGTGAVAWRQTSLNARMITGPALIGKYVVVADQLGYLHWMDKSNGKFVARDEVDSAGVTTPLVVEGNKLFVYSNSGVLFAYSI